MTTTSYWQAAPALASGRASCVSLGLMNVSARKKSSFRLVGIVAAFVALSGVRVIIVGRFDAAHHLLGHGGHKAGYASIGAGQMFPGGFLMLFVGLLESAVQPLLRLDEHAQWMGGE